MHARTGLAIGVASGMVLGAFAAARAEAGFPPFESGFEPPCSVTTNTPPGYIGGGGSGQPQNCEWGASSGAPASASSPVISNAAPASGEQHLRFQHDPGQETGNINLAADLNSRNWAFSPTITPAPPLGVVTLSFRVRITPSPTEALNAFIVQPQTPTGGQLTTVMTFFPNGTINVGDDNGNCDDGIFLTVPTGDLWIPNEWVAVAICVDTINDRIRYFYDGRMVYSTGAGEGGVGGPLGCGVFAGDRIENVLFRYEGNFDDGTIVDVDDVVIQPDACFAPDPPCPADVSDNGVVDFADVLVVIGLWGPCDGACPADVSGNGVVDFADILAIFTAWGPCGWTP